MKKETLLTTAVIALLLLNLGTLGFLFFRPGPHPPGAKRPPLDRRIEKRLHLDAAQQQTFKQLKSAHQQQIQASDRAYRETMEQYFALLKNEMPDTAQQDSLLGVLSQIQGNRTTMTFQHFQDLKALCKPNQKEEFAAMLPELMEVILPRPPKRK